MWTGPKVISKDITLESIQEVSKVLQRPPVIWDNIHANDYDQKRLFLGPYEGRSPELIPYLHGVLTNPNCEFEANFVAMHTLAQWSKSNMEIVKKDVILSKYRVSIQPCILFSRTVGWESFSSKRSLRNKVETYQTLWIQKPIIYMLLTLVLLTRFQHLLGVSIRHTATCI